MSELSFDLRRPAASPATLAPWALAAITLLVYAPAVFNGFVDWDDLTFIAGNPRFNPPTLGTLHFYWTHAGASLYMPVSYTVWSALAWLGYGRTPDAMGTRLNPYLFHLAAVLLHAVTVVLVFRLLRRVVRRTFPAFAGALVFAVHPVQVESVAFIGTMNTGIAAPLALGAVLLLLKSGDAGPRSLAPRWGSPAFLAGTLMLVLAMLSKPTAVVAPALAVLLERASRRRPLGECVALAIPWFLLCVPCVVWTTRIQPAMQVVPTPLGFRPIVMADAGAFYLRKLLIPWPLGIDYGRTPAWLFQHPWQWAWGLVPLSLLVIAIGRRWFLVLWSIGLFAVALSPTSGLVRFDYQLVSTVADRYLYLPMLGVSLCLAGAVARVPRLSRFPCRVALPALWIAALLWIVLTERQIRTWRDGTTLFEHALDVQPRSWMAAANLAEVIGDRDPDRAIALCRQAVAIRPETAFAWNNLGSLLMDRGDRNQALRAFEQAHRLAPQDVLFARNWTRARAAASRDQ